MFEQLVARHMEAIRDSLSRKHPESESTNDDEQRVSQGVSDIEDLTSFLLLRRSTDPAANGTEIEAVAEIREFRDADEIISILERAVPGSTQILRDYMTKIVEKQMSSYDIADKLVEELNRIASSEVRYQLVEL